MRTGTLLASALAGLLASGGAVAQVEPRRSETQSVQNYKVAHASYEKARKAFEKRDIAKTVAELQTCLARMPEFSDAHFLLAKVRYLEKRYPEALQHMEQAELHFEASNGLYLEAQGDRQAEVKRLYDQQDVVLADLRDALRRATTEEQRRAIEFRIEQVEHTKRELQRQLFAPPEQAPGMSPDYHFFHGNILLRLNRLDDAAAQYREALKIKPTHADASNNLASLYLSAGHAQVAKEILDQAEANGVTVNADLKQAVLNALR